MATLKEISQRTGYSAATISRILTGDPALAVTEEARKRVLEEAGRLNYAATKSRRGRTPKYLLRLAVAEMLTPAEQLQDPFYLYLHNHVEEACLERKFAFLPLERSVAGFAAPDGGCGGIIAIGRFSLEQIASLRQFSEHLVFLNSSPDESRYDSVVLNYDLGIRLAVDYLLELGHRQIGFIGPAWRLNDIREPAPEVRRTSFIAQMQRHGLFDPRFLIDAPMEARPTAEAVTAFLSSGGPLPTAFLTANEETALGTVRALTSAGLTIPGDVSLLSFNNTPLSQLVVPPLTSVSTHVEEMARAAVRLSAERSAVPGGAPVRTLPVKLVVPPSLAVRESTGAPRQTPEF